MDKKQILEKSYMPYIHKWGKITNIIGIFLAFLPQLYLGIRFGLWPQAGPVLQGFVAIAGVVGIAWVMQPIQFFPILGVAGTYMSNISGNVSNMRVPCSIAAEQAAGAEPGTPEAEICANMGTAVSTFINLFILTLGIVLGASVLSNMPPAVSQSLGYLLPALMGSCVVMVGWNQVRILPIGILLSLFIRLVLVKIVPALSSFIDIATIFGTIGISVALYKAKIYLK